MPFSIHLFGSFSLHIYGAMIALGVLAFLITFKYDVPRKNLLTMDQVCTLVALSIIAGVLGGKSLYLIECVGSATSWDEFFSFWNAGFSVLGAFIAVPLSISWYMHKHHLPIIKSFDREVIYVPLTFAISRLGCFFAGCCYGMPTTCFTAIIYTDPDSLAPLCESLHPTQLYSAFLEFLLFLFMYTLGQNTFKKPGQLFGMYFVLMSIERFAVDFLRGDRTLISDSFSFSQIAAGGIGMIGLIIFFLATYTRIFSFSSQPFSRS
jgi:phosphatidylglycerol:prolipoprotein diacylglycerol transferase